MLQVSAKTHVKLAMYGCLSCGRFLFAPNWYKLYYNVVVCSCDASHFKSSTVNAPDHIQAYWDAQFSVTSHSSYRRRLKRWTKRYFPGELPDHEAFSVQRVPRVPNLNSHSLGVKEALAVLSGRKLGASLKSRFVSIQKAHVLHRAHLFEDAGTVAKASHITKDRSEDNTTLLTDSYARARP